MGSAVRGDSPIASVTRSSHPEPASGDRKTDWNIDRHCALNLKNKNLSFSIKFVFVSREEEMRERCNSRCFYFVPRREETCEEVMSNRGSGWPENVRKTNLVPNMKFKAIVLILSRLGGIGVCVRVCACASARMSVCMCVHT